MRVRERRASLSLGLPMGRCLPAGSVAECSGAIVVDIQVGFNRICMILLPTGLLVSAILISFKELVRGLARVWMGFKAYHQKTHANSSTRICKLLKPMQIVSSYGESKASPC